MNGEINRHSVEVLWDTGAQVSIISNEFLKNFPGVVIKDISELLDTKLNLRAANGSEMPYIGWVELNFRLSSCNPDLKIPFLVTEQCLDSPLIGFNVIEEIIKHSKTTTYTQGSWNSWRSSGQSAISFETTSITFSHNPISPPRERSS